MTLAEGPWSAFCVRCFCACRRHGICSLRVSLARPPGGVPQSPSGSCSRGQRAVRSCRLPQRVRSRSRTRRKWGKWMYRKQSRRAVGATNRRAATRRKTRRGCARAAATKSERGMRGMACKAEHHGQKANDGIRMQCTAARDRSPRASSRAATPQLGWAPICHSRRTRRGCLRRGRLCCKKKRTEAGERTEANVRVHRAAASRASSRVAAERLG